MHSYATVRPDPQAQSRTYMGAPHKGAFRRLATVGQTALSNYILTSLTLQTLFVCSPLHWFGYLEYYKAYLVVCMGIANLTLS